ncbi:mechanosensitive ion channel [Echinicola jeungdonensis]|uniref:Mechanosensitive ion channel family protein n=1 Tax=Echinicola jeungdonensis TaxID=709343 RepID=A0ABV5J7R3_9BACT|nr:mechanosensitive ion channel domain-containing protein [Echinicola jeungdonensis]MDN3669676.1 mechanosensitive ion channel [Echinicola jeungdonensis]
MVNEKTKIRLKETRKSWIFLLKVLFYFVLYWRYDRILDELLPIFPLFDNFLKALTFMLGGNILVSLGRILSVHFYLRKKGQDPLQSNFVLGINRIAGILNVAILTISMMFLFGIKPLEFFTSITIVAAAIALLSKDYITNMINGLIIMFSDQLSLGDIVKIGDHQGKVIDVTLLNMVLINEDSDIVMIPNSSVLTSQILNHSKQNIKKLTFEFEMKITKSLEVNQIESRLRETLNSFDTYINKNSINLKTMAIQKEGVKFKFQFLLSSPKRDKEKEIKRIINQTIIEIACDN